MDFNGPIARRTRLRETLAIEELYRRKKAMQDRNENDNKRERDECCDSADSGTDNEEVKRKKIFKSGKKRDECCDSEDSDTGNEEVKRKKFFKRGKKRDECGGVDAFKISVSSGEDDEFYLGKSSSEQRKQRGGRNNHELINMLVDSILEIGEGTEERDKKKPSLPQKFTFGIEKPTTREKSEEEKELDELWDEMAFALACYQVDYVTEKPVDEDTVRPDVEINTARRCHHDYILDEEVGLVCKYCPFIRLEIKYVDTPFMTNPWGTCKKGSGKDDDTTFIRFEFEDSQSGCVPMSDAKGTELDIVRNAAPRLYEHQLDGFEFMWRRVARGGGGCIISHAPGTGKTRLAIIFLQQFMRQYPKCRPVIIAPCSMLLTWEEEFQKWNVDIPFHNLNKPELSCNELPFARQLLNNSSHPVGNMEAIRMVKLYAWSKEESILGISYGLFEKLTGAGAEGNPEQEIRKQKGIEVEHYKKILLERPGLLVLDEGHTPRNDQSRIWNAVSKIKTEKRILLSGTPFQNNFRELYNTLCLVTPKFADHVPSKTRNVFKKVGRPRKNEARLKWESLNLKEIKKILQPFIHVHRGTVLQESLPGLKDSVVILNTTELQKDLLEKIGGGNSFALERAVSLVSVHPSLLLNTCFAENKDFAVDREKLMRQILNPAGGVKTQFIIELIRFSEVRNEKVLIFSQFLDTLSFIMDQLISCFCWDEKKQVLCMTGESSSKERQSCMNMFNDPKSEAKVLLASTKACSEGISLVGASRVVLLDVVWNPQVERQAISRAYRLGQKKVVYIYNLIASEIEREKYRRQSKKYQFSKFVFTSDTEAGRSNISPIVYEDKILDEMCQLPQLKYMFKKVIEQPKERDMFEIDL